MTSTSFFILFIPILSILLLLINLLLAPHNSYQEKDSAFECGFHSFLGQNRTQFSISFFIFGLLFLLFDLEILLVYPYSVSAYITDIYGLIIMMVFFIILTLGFIFELGKNALSIESKQIYSFFEWWSLHNPPKPHAFSGLPLRNVTPLIIPGPRLFYRWKSPDHLRNYLNDNLEEMVGYPVHPLNREWYINYMFNQMVRSYEQTEATRRGTRYPIRVFLDEKPVPSGVKPVGFVPEAPGNSIVTATNLNSSSNNTGWSTTSGGGSITGGYGDGGSELLIPILFSLGGIPYLSELILCIRLGLMYIWIHPIWRSLLLGYCVRIKNRVYNIIKNY